MHASKQRLRREALKIERVLLCEHVAEEEEEEGFGLASLSV